MVPDAPGEVLGAVAARPGHSMEVSGIDGRHHGDVVDVGRLEPQRQVLLHDVLVNLVLDLPADGGLLVEEIERQQ